MTLVRQTERQHSVKQGKSTASGNTNETKKMKETSIQHHWTNHDEESTGRGKQDVEKYLATRHVVGNEQDDILLEGNCHNTIQWRDLISIHNFQRVDRETDIHIYKQAYRQTDRHTYIQADRQTYKQTDRQAYKQTYRQTYREKAFIRPKTDVLCIHVSFYNNRKHHILIIISSRL